MRVPSVLCLLMVLGMTGCSGGNAGPMTLWFASWADGETVPGIHRGSVELVEFGKAGGGESVKLVIWSDLPEAKGVTSSSAMVKKYSSDHSGSNGKKVHLEANAGKVVGNQDGALTIGSQSFSLKNGNVILISTQKETPVIQQIELGPDSELWKIVGAANNAEDPHTELKLFAQTEKKVGDFFKKQLPESAETAPATEAKPE